MPKERASWRDVYPDEVTCVRCLEVKDLMVLDRLRGTDPGRSRDGAAPLRADGPGLRTPYRDPACKDDRRDARAIAEAGGRRQLRAIPVKDTDDAGDTFGDRLLLSMSGTAGLKIPALTRFLFASFDYTFRLDRDGFITSETQFDHTLMARVNVTLF